LAKPVVLRPAYEEALREPLSWEFQQPVLRQFEVLKVAREHIQQYRRVRALQ